MIKEFAKLVRILKHFSQKTKKIKGGSTMSGHVNIAIAGLGTVGVGVCKILEKNGALLEKRTGKKLVLFGVSARDKKKERGVALEGVTWFDNPVEMAAAPEVDVFIELMGGSDGVAKASVEAALMAGKAVITANKALIAHHGNALAALAEESGAALQCEASVAGGIPVVKLLKEGLVANQFQNVFGIFNGTCNYILTEMRQTGRDFEEVLKEAQELGYAEADPSFDVDGVDAAHKIAILTSLAYGCKLSFEDVYIEGIRHITAQDISYAQELGYRIKLLGMAHQNAEGMISQYVYPAMVKESSQIASVEGVFNALVADGDFVDRIVAIGRGAGEGPTASAVVADMIDMLQGRALPLLGGAIADLTDISPVTILNRKGAYYVRLTVLDQAGVIADLASLLKEQNISLETLLQRGRSVGDVVSVVFVTHETTEDKMQKALQEMEALNAVTQPPVMIRMESF